MSRSAIAILVIVLVSVLGYFGYSRWNENTAKVPELQTKSVTHSNDIKDTAPVENRSRYDRVAIEIFFNQYETRLPHANTVSVCSGHGCQVQQRWQFKVEFLAELKKVFMNASDPMNERLALKRALAMIEAKVGQDTGTDKDKAGARLRQTGVRGHLDATDEALNVISYLLMLQKHNIIVHHHIAGPVWKWQGVVSNHYGVVIEEIDKPARFAIDAGVGDNGAEPLILELEDWFRL